MIESRYWKEDLLRHARKLRPVKNPPRWSERALVNFEKELMISFFMVRALLERGKLSSQVTKARIDITKYPWNGKKVTLLNYTEVEELYSFSSGSSAKVPLMFLANQFVHARYIYASRDETRNWASVLLCSDFEQENAIFSVPTSEVQRAFHLVAEDHVNWSSMVYDSAIGDFRVTRS